MHKETFTSVGIMNTVVLVTHNDNIKDKFRKNPILLRKTDKLAVANYENALDVFEELNPTVIIIHDEIGKLQTSGLIKHIRGNKKLSCSHIIILMNSQDGEFLLNSYDSGADDFLYSSSEPAEILIRVINGIKKYQINKKIQRYSANLEHFGAIDKKNKFYSYKTAEDIINMELSKNNYNAGSFVIFSLDESCKKTYDYGKMTSVIQNNLRLNDIIISYSSTKFGFLTESENASVIIERIKTEIPEDWIIRAGITSVNGINYTELEKNASNALHTATLNNEECTIYKDNYNESEDWLSEDNKVYKFYKKAFNQKIENIISPILYRTQKAYEDRIGDAKIEQFTDEKQSVLRIVLGKKESRLTMLYPGYSKLVIYISHSGLDSPENREISLPLKEISSTKISEIVEGFINEYIGIFRHSNS